MAIIKTPVGILQYSKFVRETDNYQPTKPVYSANVNFHEEDAKSLIQKIIESVQGDDIAGENSSCVVINVKNKKCKLYRKLPMHEKGDGVHHKFTFKCKDYLMTSSGKLDNRPFIIDTKGNRVPEDAQLEGAKVQIAFQPTVYPKVQVISNLFKGVIVHEYGHMPDSTLDNDANTQKIIDELMTEIEKVPELESKENEPLALQQQG